MNKRSLLIFLVNFDWRNTFQDNFSEFHDKLERDRLNADLNNFFIFSWSNISYFQKGQRYTSVHKKTRLGFFRPFIDVRAIFSIFYTVYKTKVRPDIWLAYDFNSLPALFIVKLIYGGKIFLCLNNQPRIYSNTRKFGKIKSIYSWLVEKMFSKFVDRYLTINSTMSKYIEDLGVSRSKITVFSMNTLDRDMRYIKESRKGQIREKYNVNSDNKVIMTVARLEAEKNYFELLDLFSSLERKFILFILGQGSLLSDLKEHATRLGIIDRVHFVGFITRDMIWDYYNDADVFVLLSKAEALGVVFWEAMYMNIPTIGSNVDGIIESLGRNGERGSVWDSKMGIDGFKKMINFSICPSKERDLMLDSARKYVIDQISNKVTINSIFDNSN